MSIDSKLEVQYHRHLNNLDVCNFDLSEGGNNPLGFRRGSHPFYEGRLPFEGKEVLFVLHKEVNSESDFLEVKNLFHILTSAGSLLGASQMRILETDTRIRSYYDAWNLYDGLNVPKEVWDQREGIVSNALYNRFHSEARIIIPGSIEGDLFMHRDGSFRSQVNVIPKKSKENIRSKLKTQGYNGPISFW